MQWQGGNFAGYVHIVHLTHKCRNLFVPRKNPTAFVDNVDNLKANCPHCPQTKSALAKCSNPNRVVHIVHNVHALPLAVRHLFTACQPASWKLFAFCMGGGRALGEGPSWTMVSEEFFYFLCNMQTAHQQNHGYLYIQCIYKS